MANSVIFQEIIQVIKANISNLMLNNNQKYIEIPQNNNLDILPGIYINLFDKSIESFEFELDHYIDDLLDGRMKEKKEMKDNTNHFNLKNFVSYLSLLSLKSNSRILNLNKLVKENKFSNEIPSRINQLKEEEKYNYLIKIRGDGNCYYRAFITGYIILLIEKGLLVSFINFLKFITTADIAFEISNCTNEVKIVQEVFEFILDIEEIFKKKELTFLSTHLLMNLYEPLNLAFIKILRQLIYKFINTNPDFEFNGLKLKDWIVASNMTIANFLENIVGKMGEQARDAILSVAPIMLRVNAKTCCVDTQNSNKNAFINYPCNYETFVSANLKAPDLSAETISLLFKPGHYDVLFQNTDFLKSLKKIGSHCLKPLEELFQAKLDNLPLDIESKPSFYKDIYYIGITKETKIEFYKRGNKLCNSPNKNKEYIDEFKELNTREFILNGQQNNFLCPRCFKQMKQEKIKEALGDLPNLLNLKDEFLLHNCILCLDSLHIIKKEDTIVDLCQEKKHRGHKKCIDLLDNLSVFNRCIDCFKCINDYKKKYIEEEKGEKIDKHIKEGKKGKEKHLGEERNPDRPLIQTAISCSLCPRQKYINFECSHSLCKECVFKNLENERVDRSFYCPVCKVKREIKYIYESEQEEDFLIYITKVEESIDFEREMPKLNYKCPIRNINLNAQELEFLFTKEKFNRRKNSLNILSKDISLLFGSPIDCDFCHLSKARCLRIFECNCSPNICFSCLKAKFFRLDYIGVYCRNCKKSNYYSNFIKSFNFIFSSGTLQDEFKKFHQELFKSIQILPKIRDDINIRLNNDNQDQPRPERDRRGIRLTLIIFAAFIILFLAVSHAKGFFPFDLKGVNKMTQSIGDYILLLFAQLKNRNVITSIEGFLTSNHTSINGNVNTINPTG